MLNLVTVKARTRGKTPKEFTYQGVGKVTSREVMSSEEEPKLDKDGKPVYEEDGKTPVMVKAPVRNEDGTAVTVDDIDASGVTSELQDVIDLFGTVKSETPALQRVIDGALNWFNVLARKEASPVVETVSEDELTPFIADFIKAGVMKPENEAVWRRNVTSGAKMVEVTRADYVKMTKEYKAFSKLQPATA